MRNNQKKSNATLESKKFMFILMGFIVALSVLYISFEWSSKDVAIHLPIDTIDLFIDDPHIAQTQEPPPPPPPPPLEMVLDVLNPVPDDELVASIPPAGSEDDGRAVIPQPVPRVEIIEVPSDVPIDIAEIMPEFPGGIAALMQFLRNNIRYPVLAIENNIQGRVVLQFIVNTDGSIVDIQVVRSIDPLLDREAIRVVQTMPHWRPGKQGNQPVRVRFTLPIKFQLEQRR